MSYLGKIEHERTFGVGQIVVRLDPSGILGLRRKGDRTGFTFFDLADLLLSNTSPGQIAIHQAKNSTSTGDLFE